MGCNKTKVNDKIQKFSFDKNGNYVGFSDLPLKYTIENAKADGCFVTQNSEVIVNQDVWNNFIEASLRKENANIRMVQFYTENKESPFFTDLFYNDGYYYLFDSSAVNLKKEPFLYLLTLECKIKNPFKNTSVIVLTNDSTLTYEKVEMRLISSYTDYMKSVPPFRIVMFK